MPVTINVTGLNDLRKRLDELSASPALQKATDEAAAKMFSEVAGMVAISTASYHLAEMRQRHEAKRPRRIVTEADLARLGVKRLLDK